MRFGGIPLLGLAVPSCGSGWVQLIPGLNPGDHGVTKLGEVGVNRAQLLLHLPREVDVALLDCVALLGDGHVLEEGDDVLLPEDALVFLLQVDEGVASLAVPDVWQASLDTQAQVVADDLHTPPSPHVVVAANRLAITHETEVHGRANEIPVEGKVHAAHGEQGSLGDCHDSINIPFIPLLRLDQLCGSIIVRDVQPQAVGDSSVGALPEAEGVSTHKVSTLTVGVVQGVEEEWGGWAEEVLDVLLKSVDVLARWVLGNEAIVVDGVDVLLLGDHVAEAAARGVLEGDAGRLGAEDAVDVVAVVELVVEALGHLDGLGRIAVLHDDEVVRLEEGPPHLQEVEVADRRDHDVELVLEQRRGGDVGPRDGHRARHCCSEVARLLRISISRSAPPAVSCREKRRSWESRGEKGLGGAEPLSLRRRRICSNRDLAAMSQKKTLARGGDIARPPPLQAVVLADSFMLKFHPITLERPKVLLPLVNKPVIDYTLRWLESAGVEEAFVFCCAHSHQVKEYLDKAGWSGTRSMAVICIESEDAISAGDALRVIYDRHVIHGDFVLISGDVASNMSLKDALQEHMDRKKNEPLIMTMVIKHSEPTLTRLGDDGNVMVIDPETKELLYYKDRADNPHLHDKDILTNNTTVVLHNGMEDCYIDICSPEVLCLFNRNFCYHHLRRHFVKGLLVDNIGYKIYAHELRSGYAARIDNFRSYATMSKDIIIERWTPDVISSLDCSQSRFRRQRIYMASDVTLSPSAHVVGNSVVGSATSIGDHCRVLNSVIGEGCQIGKYVWINDSFIWDNVIIEDGCKVKDSFVCDGVHLRAGAVVEPGCVLSFKVEVGKNVVVPALSKVSLLPQPSNEDSDEELEYADINFGITDTLAFSSMWSTGDQTTVPLEEDETGDCGVVGYIWRSVDTGIVGERRQQVAHYSSHNVVEDADRISKFEKKVEELFRQALGGDGTPDNLILKIDGLRLAYSPQCADCAGAVFYSIMKSALVAAQSTYGSVLVPTLDTLDKWQEVLHNYTKTIDDEMAILIKFGVLYQETKKGFSRVFPEVLACLYDMWLVSGGGILRWAEEKERADESYKFVVEQSKDFIQWLKKPIPPEDDEEVEHTMEKLS